MEALRTCSCYKNKVFLYWETDDHSSLQTFHDNIKIKHYVYTLISVQIQFECNIEVVL
jgi:hypothetical protein